MRAAWGQTLDKQRGYTDRRLCAARTHVLKQLKVRAHSLIQGRCEPRKGTVPVIDPSWWQITSMIVTDQKDTRAGFNRAPIPKVGLLNQLNSVTHARRMTRPCFIFPSPFRLFIMLVCKFLALEQYKYARKSCSTVVNWPCSHLRAVCLILL